MATSIIHETNNFLDLYMAYVGETECPERWQYWCALSLLAACVQDRVWYQKLPHERLYPNLFLILLGPSGLGKGASINPAIKLVSPSLLEPRPTQADIGFYNGKVTAPALLDWLGKPHLNVYGNKVRNEKIWLVTPELTMSLRSGGLATDFIQTVTELFSCPRPFTEMTRTGGSYMIEAPCVNWLGGTNAKWFIDAIPLGDFEGGFVARCTIIEADYGDKRITEPKPHPEEALLQQVLLQRVRILSSLGFSGEFRMTESAKELHDNWYQHRPVERDPALRAAWQRDDSLMLKLAMLLSLAERYDRVIDRIHVRHAQDLIKEAHTALPGLIRNASSSGNTFATREAHGIEDLRSWIKNAGTILHSHLSRKAAARGILSDRREKLLRTLIQSDEIKVITKPSGGVVYSWNAGRRVPRGAEAAGDGDGDGTDDATEAVEAAAAATVR